MENTIIIYSSDHGEMLQDKGFYQKALPYESCSRIPFIVRYPEKIKAGTVSDEFVDLLDLFPTMLDVADIDYNYNDNNKKYNLVGESLFQNKIRDRKYQRVDYGLERHRWVFVRDERYKYVYFFDGGIEQFYDLKNDPQEVDNLMKDNRAPQDDYKRLKKKCIEIEKELGPEDYVKNDDFIKFEYEELPQSLASKFPLWSNFQFQNFREKFPKDEARKYLDEMKEATSIYTDANFLKEKILADPEFREDWFENFKKFGGDEAGRKEITGK